MANTALNRTTQALLTNKSGGALNYGDVVVLDNTNDNGFTTTTTAGLSTRGIGVILEPNGIANNASGMVAIGGWCPKVNLNTAATDGQFLKTHTVAGQATPHASPQVEGDFAVALTASATPAAMLFGSANGPTSGGAGTVTTTGSPASGNLTKFSGATSITNGDLSGDVTTSSTLATTIANNAVTTAKINNSAVTLAKIANAAANSKWLGSGASGSGAAYTENSFGTGLSVSSTTLNASGLLIGQQVITATGAYTYTPTSGTNSIIIELVGAGGGGGGLAQPGGSSVSIARGGGAGAYLRKRLTANFSGATGVVGAKGTGGAAGANPGTNGADTTFIDTAGSPTTYTAGGGSGGSAGVTSAAPTSRLCATGGVATNGTVNVGGMPGISGLGLASSSVTPSWGGDSVYGTGGQSSGVSSNAGNDGTAGTGNGSGGSGAVGSGTSGNHAGGDGTNGIVIIWEYS